MVAEDRQIRPEELAWWRSNIDDLRDMTTSDRILRGMLWATLLGGLLLQVVGWLIPEGRLSELVTNVAIALWTGAVLVGLLELRVRSKRRQTARYLAQVEQALGLPPTETSPSVEERLAALEAKIDDLILRLDGAGSSGRSDQPD